MAPIVLLLAAVAALKFVFLPLFSALIANFGLLFESLETVV